MLGRDCPEETRELGLDATEVLGRADDDYLSLVEGDKLDIVVSRSLPEVGLLQIVLTPQSSFQGLDAVANPFEKGLDSP
jgi:hypothetical protein